MSISNLIMSGYIGCTISTCVMELFGLLLPTILPLPCGSLLSSLRDYTIWHNGSQSRSIALTSGWNSGMDKFMSHAYNFFRPSGFLVL
jgi:hypothetical protein